MDLAIGTWHISIRRSPLSDAELAAMYDDAARAWTTKLSHGGYAQAYVDLFARLPVSERLDYLQDGGRVLDCGIGSGALSLALTEAVGTQLRLDGVDIAPRMLREASEALRQAGVQAQMHHHDARDDLPFADATFDLVMSAHLLEHLADPRAALGEMARVLRPGAPLVAVVTGRGVRDNLLRLKWRYSSIRPARLARWIEEAELTEARTYEVVGRAGAAPHWLGIACVGLKGI
jgi:ubiquinone/menaquinone biosynthesis C-methylase UbiE